MMDSSTTNVAFKPYCFQYSIYIYIINVNN